MSDIVFHYIGYRILRGQTKFKLMRRNLNFMARSFSRDALKFFRCKMPHFPHGLQSPLMARQFNGIR